ncbi:MAG: hypothetical protein LBU72_05245 [Burkholderiaceae bacterium]|jgi:hypothetical protein|nr:hypothetical protein [Burkholderiaceae bacterium]
MKAMFLTLALPVALGCAAPVGAEGNPDASDGSAGIGPNTQAPQLLTKAENNPGSSGNSAEIEPDTQAFQLLAKAEGNPDSPGNGVGTGPGTPKPELVHAFGMDLFMSSDADKNDVRRLGFNFDIKYRNPEQYLGIRLEHAWYRLDGQETKIRDRGFIWYADKNSDWAWNAQVGTDGNTVIGSADIHDNAKFRKEFFVERDIIETPMGFERGLYYTFLGGAVDIPMSKNDGLALVGGVQDFTGSNVRWHAKATYTHMLVPDWGLSIQLRTRYYYDTQPWEYDYYSPKYYFQVLPTLQIRRYYGGWRYMLAVGLGGQRAAEDSWHPSRFMAAEITSPPIGRNWYFKASALYSNTPFEAGIYDYVQFMLSLTRRF